MFTQSLLKDKIVVPLLRLTLNIERGKAGVYIGEFANINNNLEYLIDDEVKLEKCHGILNIMLQTE